MFLYTWYFFYFITSIRLKNITNISATATMTLISIFATVNALPLIFYCAAKIRIKVHHLSSYSLKILVI